MYVNKVILSGKIVNQPTLRKTKKNVPVTNFTVRTVEKHKNHNTGVVNSKVNFHKVVCWGAIAETAVNKCEKDKFVLIEGELSNHKYKPNENDEKSITNTEVKATRLYVYNGTSPNYEDREDEDDSNVNESDTDNDYDDSDDESSESSE